MEDLRTIQKTVLAVQEKAPAEERKNQRAARGHAQNGLLVVIEQGFALDRPSILRVNATGDSVKVVGNAVIAAAGVLHL